ncbi:MAG: hypothetical protein MZU95_01190 [Desulfomicrobium escambiense]|nr:hypothetical protein [Desulfomicrobium escambiense]
MKPGGLVVLADFLADGFAMVSRIHAAEGQRASGRPGDRRLDPRQPRPVPGRDGRGALGRPPPPRGGVADAARRAGPGGIRRRSIGPRC